MTPKLDAEMKQAWCTALRSGKYLQRPTKPHVRTQVPSPEDEYCPLTLLSCVVYPEMLGIMASCKGDQEMETFMFSFFGDGIPAHEVINLHWSGKTFSEIADWIEVNL